MSNMRDSVRCVKFRQAAEEGEERKRTRELTEGKEGLSLINKSFSYHWFNSLVYTRFIYLFFFFRL